MISDTRGFLREAPVLKEDGGKQKQAWDPAYLISWPGRRETDIKAIGKECTEDPFAIMTLTLIRDRSRLHARTVPMQGGGMRLFLYRKGEGNGA